MLRSISVLLKQNSFSCHSIRYHHTIFPLTKIELLNPSVSPKVGLSLSLKTLFAFSSYKDKTPHLHKNQGHKNHNHGEDPIIRMRKQLETYAKQVQQNYPNQPEQIIKQIYTKCQGFVGQNKKVQILLLFEILSDFIQSKNLIEQYSTFNIISANNSFMMGRYKQVIRRCMIALPHQIKKHGEVHKNIADIYNMLGISLSKVQNPKPKQALDYLQKAFKIRNEIMKESQQSAEVLFNCGIIEQQHEKSLQKAQKYYLDAVQMLQNSDNQAPVLYLKTKMRLADLQVKIHKVILKYISDMLRIQQIINRFKSDKKFSQNDITQVQMFYSLLQKNMGKAYMQSGDFQKAIKYFQMCLQYLRKNNMETQDRIFVLENCSASYAALNDYTKAAQLFQQGDQILTNLQVTDQYKYNYLRFLAQIYRKSQAYQKQIETLQRIKNLLNKTKDTFFAHEDICEIEMCLIFALGNAQNFDQVVKKGHQLLKFIEETKTSFLVANRDQDLISNIYAYIGFAHFSTKEFNLASEFFEKSDAIFSRLFSTDQRAHFHMNVLRKLASLEIQVKRNLLAGFVYLERLRNVILSSSKMNNQNKLKELVVLLLDYEINPSNFESVDQMVSQMIEAKYVQNINGLLQQIVKVLQKLSQTPQSKQIIESCYFLVVSIYQMLLSFNNEMKPYEGKYEANLKTKKLLSEIIGIYDMTFAAQIGQVRNDCFKGGQTLKDFIMNLEGIKRELQSFQLIK